MFNYECLILSHMSHETDELLMRPALLAVGAAGFAFWRVVGCFAKAIGKCKRSHTGINKIMESSVCAYNVGDGAAWAE